MRQVWSAHIGAISRLPRRKDSSGVLQVGGDRILLQQESNFRCDQCEEGLEGKRFLMEGEKCVCQTCYNTYSAPLCARCSQPIVSSDPDQKTTIITCNGQNFHLDCYTCTVSLSAERIDRIHDQKFPGLQHTTPGEGRLPTREWRPGLRGLLPTFKLSREKMKGKRIRVCQPCWAGYYCCFILIFLLISTLCKDRGSWGWIKGK